jgi:hypothetical protein
MAVGLMIVGGAVACSATDGPSGLGSPGPTASASPSASYFTTLTQVHRSNDCRYSVAGRSGAWIVTVRVAKPRSSGRATAQGFQSGLPTVRGGHVSPGHPARFRVKWRYPGRAIAVTINLDSLKIGSTSKGPGAIICTPDWM